MQTERWNSTEKAKKGVLRELRGRTTKAPVNLLKGLFKDLKVFLVLWAKRMGEKTRYSQGYKQLYWETFR